MMNMLMHAVSYEYHRPLYIVVHMVMVYTLATYRYVLYIVLAYEYHRSVSAPKCKDCFRSS